MCSRYPVNVILILTSKRKKAEESTIWPSLFINSLIKINCNLSHIKLSNYSITWTMLYFTVLIIIINRHNQRTNSLMLINTSLYPLFSNKDRLVFSISRRDRLVFFNISEYNHIANHFVGRS